MPNFSEGRDAARIQALVAAIAGVPGAIVLDRTSDPDHNRTVITFAGSGSTVVEAAVRGARKAAELIDLTTQHGVHPRLGALDVLPFVPLADSSMRECIDIAHEAGRRIWKELGIPVYFYESAALRPDRKKLENVRRGEFDALRVASAVDPAKAPDLGGPALHPTAGAVAVGARKFLIAFNVNLQTGDVSIAKRIARGIRESSGGLPGIKALGLSLGSRNLSQVSMNITDFERTPVHVVLREIEKLAATESVLIAGYELIGLMPRKAVEMALAEGVKLPGFDDGSILENRLDKFLPR